MQRGLCIEFLNVFDHELKNIAFWIPETLEMCNKAKKSYRTMLFCILRCFGKVLASEFLRHTHYYDCLAINYLYMVQSHPRRVKERLLTKFGKRIAFDPDCSFQIGTFFVRNKDPAKVLADIHFYNINWPFVNAFKNFDQNKVEQIWHAKVRELFKDCIHRNPQYLYNAVEKGFDPINTTFDGQTLWEYCTEMNAYIKGLKHKDRPRRPDLDDIRQVLDYLHSRYEGDSSLH